MLLRRAIRSYQADVSFPLQKSAMMPSPVYWLMVPS